MVHTVERRLSKGVVYDLNEGDWKNQVSGCHWVAHKDVNCYFTGNIACFKTQDSVSNSIKELCDSTEKMQHTGHVFHCTR